MARGEGKLMSNSHACAHISDGLILGARAREKKKSQGLTSEHGVGGWGGIEEWRFAQVGFTKRCRPCSIGIISGAEAIDTHGRPHSSLASIKALLCNGGRATYVYSGSGSRWPDVFSSLFMFLSF